MARRDVVEITCDRCLKVETQAASEAPQIKEGGSEVEATFHGETVAYKDLCRRCRDAVRGYFSRLARKPEVPEASKEAVEAENVTQLEQPAPTEGVKKKSLFGTR